VTKDSSDVPLYWRIPAVLAWSYFFMLGLFPIWTFQSLRSWGGVLTQDAIINSPHFITLAWALFLGYFAYSRCIEAGIEPDLARGKATQLAVLALPAFMCGPLEDVVLYRIGYVEYFSYLTVSVASFKMLLWCYLFFKILRYYLGPGHIVFTKVPSLFPSTYRDEDEEEIVTVEESAPVEEVAPSEARDL